MGGSAYYEAAKVLHKLETTKLGIKALLYKKNSPKDVMKKAVMALVCKVLPHVKVLKKVMADLTPSVPKGMIRSPVSRCTMQIMIFEMCVTKQRITCGGPIKKFLSEHKQEVLEIYQKYTKAISAAKTFQFKQSIFTYVRINVLKCSRQAMLEKLQSPAYGFKLAATKQEVASVPNMFCMDELIPDLLVFNRQQKKIFALDLVLESFELLIQDKASCFSATALDPQPGWSVIDSCAAPGNKTSHLASLMEGKGNILAFEKDTRRFQILKQRMKEIGASTIVKSEHMDFLKTNPFDFRYAKVNAILVDPTCSGSGIESKNRFESMMKQQQDSDDEVGSDEEVSEERKKKEAAKIKKLADFQVKILCHALKFPSVTRVVYSTCSVNIEENEDVVDRVLKSSGEFEVVKTLPNWHRRGSLYTAFADKCVRCSPDEDGTHGFFVCCFERKAIVD
eukprot:TRINITY_DN7789_c0_g2_i1.p1 TRINITY_DN7789_c0_g2~~TRINITY_DN7789_c0_g2_i1.p1  ORF type:complete len:450 (-),score=125.03 TRINITY_DN7789_c0_g2_i1:79-1428(-)